MRKFLRVLLVLWAGSLWSLALWVAPTLFHAQPDRHLAGMLVTRLFSIQTYLGLAAALLALLLPGRTRFAAVYLAVALLAVNEWFLKHFMTVARAHGAVAGLSFGAWHGVSALVYLAACLCVVLVVVREEI